MSSNVLALPFLLRLYNLLYIPYSFLHTILYAFFLSLCLLLVMWFRNLHQVRLTQIESCDLLVPVPILLSRSTLALSSLVASCAIGREMRKKKRQKGKEKKSVQRLKVNSISAFISFSSRSRIAFFPAYP